MSEQRTTFTTLNSIIKEHPEWGNLPLVVYKDDGSYSYVDVASTIYTAQDADNDTCDLIETPDAPKHTVLVFDVS